MLTQGGAAPEATNHEEWLLGAAMADAGAAAVVASIPDEAWASPAHRRIASAISSLVKKNTEANIVSVRHALANDGHHEEADRLYGILANGCSATYAKECKKAILAASRKRLTMATARRLQYLIGDEDADDATIEKEIQKLNETWNSSASGHGAELLDLRSLVAADLRPPWLYNRMLALGDLAMVAAAYGVGKTWFALDMALSLCTGRPFMEERPTTSGPALIFDSENPLHSIGYRLRALGGTTPPNNLHIAHFSGIKLDDPGGVMKFRNTIETVSPLLVILDTLSRFHCKDENKASEMMPVLNTLLEICRKGQVAIVLLHHFSKNDGTKSLPQLIRGTTSFGDACDQVFAMENSQDGVKTTHVKGRHDMAYETFVWKRNVRSPGDVELQVVSRGNKSKSEECAELIRNWVAYYTKTHGKAPLRKDIVDEFKVEHGMSERTLNRALKVATQMRLLAKTSQDIEGVRYFVIGGDNNGEEVNR